MITEGVVCVCSRGMMMSRTAESIDRNKEYMFGYWLTEYTHDDEIPVAQNNVTRQALVHSPEFIWYVEEDVVPPCNALSKMVEYAVDYDIPVVTAWYKLDGGLKSYEVANDDTLLFAGLGCLLVRATMYDQLELPYFRTDTVWTAKVHEGIMERQMDRASERGYGKQDIHFFGVLSEKKIKCALVDIECVHLGIKKWGAQGDNRGVHRLRIKG